MNTYDAVYPWVPVEIPHRFRSNGVSQQLVDLRAVPEILKDLLGDGAGQPLLVVRILYEGDPSCDSERAEDNQRRPSALPTTINDRRPRWNLGTEGSPRWPVALFSASAWRSIGGVLRAKRRFRRGVVRSELVCTVDEPRGLPSRRAESSGSTRASGLELAR